MTSNDKFDIRVVRLAVKIFRSDMKPYFSRRENWKFGFLYCGLQGALNLFDYNCINYFVSFDEALDAFQSIFVTNPSSFTTFLDYMLSDFITRNETPVPPPWVMKSFQEIGNELLSLGYRYDFRTHRLISVVGTEQQRFSIESDLDILLRKVDPNFVSMRRGGWEAFLSGGADALRQCVSSARELLRQCVDKMSPSGQTRKQKVQQILKSEKESTLVEGLCEVVDALYGTLSKEEHTYPTKETALFTLRTVENILYLLLNRVLAS